MCAKDALLDAAGVQLSYFFHCIPVLFPPGNAKTTTSHCCGKCCTWVLPPGLVASITTSFPTDFLFRINQLSAVYRLQPALSSWQPPLGRPFSSTSSTTYMIPLCHSFPSGQGFHGTHMKSWKCIFQKPKNSHTWFCSIRLVLDVLPKMDHCMLVVLHQLTSDLQGWIQTLYWTCHCWKGIVHWQWCGLKALVDQVLWQFSKWLVPISNHISIDQRNSL